MVTKEIAVRSAEGWTTRYKDRTRVELPENSSLREGFSLAWAECQFSLCIGTPGSERVKETSQAYRRDIKQGVDAICVNLGTTYGSLDESRPACGQCCMWGGAPVVVRDGESPSHGEGGQSSISAQSFNELSLRRDV